MKVIDIQTFAMGINNPKTRFTAPGYNTCLLLDEEAAKAVREAMAACGRKRVFITVKRNGN